MAKKHRSDQLAAIHETALGWHEAGIISPRTMQEFTISASLPSRSSRRGQLFRLRKRAKVSQAVLAHHLNVPPTTISQWERGERLRADRP